MSRGYVATTATGAPYLFASNFQSLGALIDFTNPAAVSWWQGRLRAVLDLGVDGFMQDFGEQVLPDMHFHDGETGASMHNQYPVFYQQATRALLDQYQAQHSGRRLFFFTRAGYSGRDQQPGTAAYENANFPGDETTDWSVSSGLASQTPDMLNRAVGGAYGFGTDIGGYFDIAVAPPTTKELFIRWAQWAALSPVFRLHGSVSAGTHVPWSYDQQTVDIYNRLSALHLAARPLILSLWAHADRTGIPPTRPLWLAYPQDPQAAHQDPEWLLGPDVLVAPVVTQGATSRSVYFPTGCWQDPQTLQTYNGPQSRTLAVPLTKLAYFFRCETQPFTAPGGAALAASGAAGRPACLATARLRFTIHQNNGRVTRVRAFISGRLVKTIWSDQISARRVRHVSILRPAGRNFTVRIEANTVRHKRVVSSRRYISCRKTAPRTVVHHRPRVAPRSPDRRATAR